MRKSKPAPVPPERTYTVKSLVKALNILDVLAEGEDSAYTITELSRQMRLNLTTVHRLVANLVKQGYLEEVPGGRSYRLGFKVLRMGLGVLEHLDVRQAAQPLLQSLTLQIREAVHLAILQNTGALVVAAYASPRPGSVDIRLGDTAPLHCSAVGKMLLAYQPRVLLGQIARTSGFPRYTLKTSTDMMTLRKELERIREQGYALDQEETAEGMIGVAGPIFDHAGEVVAAIGVAGPATRLSRAHLPEIIGPICAAGERISFHMGYRGK